MYKPLWIALSNHHFTLTARNTKGTKGIETTVCGERRQCRKRGDHWRAKIHLLRWKVSCCIWSSYNQRRGTTPCGPLDFGGNIPSSVYVIPAHLPSEMNSGWVWEATKRRFNRLLCKLLCHLGHMIQQIPWSLKWPWQRGMLSGDIRRPHRWTSVQALRNKSLHPLWITTLCLRHSCWPAPGSHKWLNA